MIFDSILELTISTDAPIPDDKTCRRVIDWARQYVESQAVGEASDFAIICVTETMGRLFKTKGRWADSAKMYDERMTWVRSKLQRQPGDRDTQETLRNTLIQAGKAKVKAKQPDAGRRDLEEALGMLREAAAHSEGKAKAELLEKASDVAVVLGDVAFESGDAGKAVLSYEDALNDDRELFSQHPDDRVAQRQNLRIDLTRLSQAHRKAKNWPAAEATATEAVNLARVNVSISPNNKDVRDELVETLTKAAEIHATQFSDQSALRKSLDCMTELLTVDPHHAGARSFRGYTHALLGEKEEAVKDFRDTLLDKPGSLPVLRLFGWSYVVLGEPSAALQPWDEYRRVTQASGKPPGGDALMVFAAAEWIRGASEQAVAYYRQFATAAPEWQKSESIGEADWPETRKRVVEAIRARAYP